MTIRMMTAAAALAAAAGGLGLPGSALGQCSVQRHNVPDFDQVRSALPNSGNMYCVPTSAMNWMAYIANHGWPLMMLETSPQDWQSQGNYAQVTNELLLMGALMGTSPTGGTSGSGGRSGLQNFMNPRSFGLFTATYTSGEISPINLYLHMLGGNLVNVCYGFYKPVPNLPGRYYRDGGHCITVNGVFNACGGTPWIRFRDPASGGATVSDQSTFTSATSNLVRQTFQNFAGFNTTRWRMTSLGVGEATRRYLDGRYIIQPMIALTASPTRSGELLTLRPVRLPGTTLPSESSAPVPDGGAITGVALLPEGIEAVVTTVSPGPVPQHKAWRYLIPTGEFTQVYTCTGGLAAATSRFGEVYIACTDGIRRIQLHEGGDVSILQHAAVLQDFHFIAYDDARDEVVGVSTDARLVRFTHTLDLVSDDALPAVQLTGRVSLAIDEAAQRYFVAGSDGNSIFELALVPGAPAQLVSEIQLPAVQRVAALQFNDAGHLVIVHEGGIAEFARTTEGGWAPAPGSPLAGLAGRGALAIPRSRTDFIVGVHDTPEWANVLVEENNEERPDCRADWDVSGMVDSGDISAFLTDWLRSVQGGVLTGDFGGDGVVDSSDIAAFLTAWLGDVTQGCW